MHRILALLLVLRAAYGYSDEETSSGQCILQEQWEPSEDHVLQESGNAVRQFSRREGFKLAQELHENAEWIDFQEVIHGIEDYVSGKPVLASLEGDETSFNLAVHIFEAEAKKNLEGACLFLQKMVDKPTVHSLENGKILYEVLQEGRGTSSVQENGCPRLQYTIWSLDGKEIVTTRKGIGSHTVPLAETISGFAKGVKGMREGERRRLYIHPEFGYALFGHVTPNALLIVDVEVEALQT